MASLQFQRALYLGLVGASALVLVAVACGDPYSESSAVPVDDAAANEATTPPGEPTFALALEPTSVSVVAGGPGASVHVSLVRMNGFAQPVSITISGLPPAATAASLTIDGQASAGSIALSAPANAPQGRAALIATGVSGDGRVSVSAPFSLLVRGTPGAIDTTFGQGGIRNIDLAGASYVQAIGIAAQPDDAVLVATSGDCPGGACVQVMRLGASGAADPSFGASGIAQLKSSFRAMVLDGAGRAILAGRQGNDVVLTRLTTAGTIDTSFGTSGTAVATCPSGGCTVNTVALDPAGNIVVAGAHEYCQGVPAPCSVGMGFVSDFLVWRLLPTGAPDPSFAGGTPRFVDFGQYDFANGLAFTKDTIVAVGLVNGNKHQWGILRLLANGSPDPAFGTNGALASGAPLEDGVPYGATVLANGRIAVGGYGTNAATTPDEFAVLAFDGAGLRDLSFGVGGQRYVSFDPSGGRAFAFLTQKDGKSLVGGSAGAQQTFAIARITADGSLDATFGAGGKVTTDFGTTGRAIRAMTLLSDGRIVALGDSNDGIPSNRVRVTRYWP